ncbi:MAG: N-formylglutamate amidohydrolase [Pseudolabrys sp.]|nr:N-formylglutamate amidohydrolase [Pseudolabrys sp.]
MSAIRANLLAKDETAPVTVYNEGGRSPLLLVADHAGKAIPRALGDLGVSDSERGRHIGWDIGIAGVSRHLADALDAVLIAQNYSRLVIDCNRPPGVPSSMPEISELTPVPGNVALSDADKAARVAEIFQPYHDRIKAELDRRQKSGHPVTLIAMHSFTPVYKDEARPWHIGLLYNRDARLSQRLLALLQADPGLTVGDQEPYTVSDLTDYTVPVHGEQRGLHHTAIEIRQDLIADDGGQKQWAKLLARLLPQAYRAL